MNVLYVLAGIALVLFGIWLTIKKAKVFMRGKQDKFGADINLFGTGIMCIMLGVALITHYV